MTRLKPSDHLKAWGVGTDHLSMTALDDGSPHSVRVLVIEDAEPTLQLIKMVLARFQCQVEGCADGTAGLARARSWLPDLIILDLALPGLGGWEVMGGLRCDPATARIPVVITTAHAAPEVRSRARAEGAAAFFAKPFEPAAMRAVVEPLLRAGVR